MTRTRISVMCTVALTLEIWPSVKFMPYLWVKENNCLKYYLDTTWQQGVIFQASCTLTFEIWRHDTAFVHGQRFWEILPSTARGLEVMTRTRCKLIYMGETWETQNFIQNVIWFLFNTPLIFLHRYSIHIKHKKNKLSQYFWFSLNLILFWMSV